MGICVRAETGASETPAPPIDVKAIVNALKASGRASIPLDPPQSFTDLADALRRISEAMTPVEVFAQPGNGRELILVTHE